MMGGIILWILTKVLGHAVGMALGRMFGLVKEHKEAGEQERRIEAEDEASDLKRSQEQKDQLEDKIQKDKEASDGGLGNRIDRSRERST